MTRRTLLLIGAGHAHLHLLRHRHRLPVERLVLVDPGGFWYSGLATGMLGGRCSPEADRIDPAALARRQGADACRARLVGLDARQRQAHLDDGRTLDYTLLSLNIGSSVRYPTPLPDGLECWPVKPIPCLLALRLRLARDFSLGKTLRLVVLGGGASGVEVACNLRALARWHGATAEIILLTGHSGLLSQAPPGAVAWLRQRLEALDIQVRPHAQAAPADADHLIIATGLIAPAVIERLGLPARAERGLVVTETLQSPATPEVFAAGDCAALDGYRLPRLGVHGVRQAPVLLANLVASLTGKAPSARYLPRRHALSILDLGDGQGLALRGRHWWGGRLALLAKRYLDTRFLARYR
ncbi:NAD(P)/FAD-dependent oxidoreductase [Halomonas caseinilytica]|uniref:NAD(P)/FAD-dependent oxidoreductase n=1 Tax=Halomonas caseinilytica TaxID=438744 RepID=UPI0008490A94|nr:FAD-dependent oxidoreductase [Halomonas caseinilytica]